MRLPGGIAVLLASGLACGVARGEGPTLGRIVFPVSASGAVAEHFVRGVLALHSFWYEEARDEFRAATALDPRFAMGYWGEALSHCHFVWGDEDVAAERDALAKIPRDAKLTARERGFIDAARTLVGPGAKADRWRAYTGAMARLHRAYPDDDEAATLYAVALLGSSPRDGRFRPFAEAGAIALDVLARNPDHPGAAHYIIHAFDDPEHAILALPAARRYAQIAPEAYHARHMPSHIFVQLGMWKEAQAANESAWAASLAAAEKKHLDASYDDFHSLSWLISIDLERGQPERAREALQRGFDALRRSHDPDRMPGLVGAMAATYVQATDDWSELDALTAPLSTVEHSMLTSPTAVARAGCASHATGAAKKIGLDAQATLAFLHGEAAAAQKDSAGLARARRELAALCKRMEPNDAKGWAFETHALDALVDEAQRKAEPAIAALREAIRIDDGYEGKPSGPAGAITARERLGELLLRLGRAKDALAEFAQELDRRPLRSRSLLGAARAARALHDDRARTYYAELAANWTDAQPSPVLDEVRLGATAP